MSLDSKLASLASVPQKDKGAAYCDVLKQLVSASPPSADDMGQLVRYVVSQDHVGLVVARQVLGELVKALDEDPLKANDELQKSVILSTLESIQRSVSFQEQVGYQITPET